MVVDGSGSNDVVRLFDSPTAYMRALRGLSLCELHFALREPLLRCKLPPEEKIVHAEDGVEIVQGPPGTGKTWEVVNELERMKSVPLVGPTGVKRILVTSITNEGVDNCYRMALARGVLNSTTKRKKITTLCTTVRGRRQGLDGCGEDPCKVTGRLIVFSTIASRNNSKWSGVDFDIILVDEAGLATDADIFGLLRKRTRRLVLIGDHQQLRCRVSPGGKPLCHDRSTMERLAEGGYPIKMLTQQRRMNLRLCELVSKAFYGNKLECVNDVPGSDGALTVIDTPGKRCVARGTSWCNPPEASIAVGVANEKIGEDVTVAIITPYATQVEMLQGDKTLDSRVEVLTIDAAQGREWTHVILTTVRDDGSVGFFSEPSRVLVATSRARESLCIVGHRDTWRKSQSPLAKYLEI